jgi:RNA polymerase sigma factor (sigma-70 family)
MTQDMSDTAAGLLAPDGADPEDLAGDVFVDVTRNLPRFRGNDAQLRAWVFTIARRRLIDGRRRRARRPTVLVADVPDTPDPRIHDDHSGVLAALGHLTAARREVLVLRFIADLPLADVARLTHRRVGSVKALQRRALDALAAELDGDPQP